MKDEFPPNSHTQKEERRPRPSERAVERKEVKQVTRSKATVRKKPLRRKFLEAFRPEDGRGFMEVAVMEVLVPGIKDAVANSATDAIENALGVQAPRGRRGRGGYTSYSGMGGSRPRGRRERMDDRREPQRRESRVADDTREIVLNTRVEADEVIDNLFELISKYEVATMRDLLSLIGEPYNPVHEDWGWYDLRGARIHRVGGGYLLDLPRPEPLD